jgi:hypothetical protein
MVFMLLIMRKMLSISNLEWDSMQLGEYLLE